MIADDGTKVARPHDLRSAMNALDRLLSPELIEGLRTGEIESFELHHGVGTALRSYWGLWSGGSLHRWFRIRDIHHADDMSAIILESYTRRLRGQPIALREQIAKYKRFWAEQDARYRAELASGPERAAKVEAARMGWTLVERQVPTLPPLRPPEHDDALLRVARLERYAGGVLAFGRHVYGEPAQLWPKWHTGVYFLAAPDSELEYVERRDCGEIHDVVTLGERTHWLCRSGAAWHLLEEAAGVVEPRSIELDAEFLRLGSHGDAPLLLSDRAVYQREGDGWRAVYRRDEPWFAAEATTPRQLGDHLFFARVYHRSALVRVDLSGPSSSDASIDVDVCRTILRPFYGRWAVDCHMVAPSDGGGLWVTGGHRFRSTLALLRSDAVELAVFAGSVDRAPEYREGLLHVELDEAEFRRQIPATAAVEHDGVLYLAGELGLMIGQAGVVEPLVRFDVPYEEWRVSSFSSHPRDLAPFGDSQSFALAVDTLAVVRATDAGFELRWPKRP